MIESQRTRLYLNVAIAMLVHELWTGLFKSGKHLNSFVPHCMPDWNTEGLRVVKVGLFWHLMS
jgi:hypothetical protein